jgi:hypothetical protein
MMLPSSVIIVTSDGEYLMCSGFSLDETVHLGNFKFIAEYFGGLNLSTRRSDVGAAFMGSTHSGASTPWWALTGDSADEFLTEPSFTLM